MCDLIDLKLAANLHRWLESGQPQEWCAARRGLWNDADWRALLGALWCSDYWPMDAAAVKTALEELSHSWNLRRWQESGQPLQWIVCRAGAWGHADWLVLLDELRQSEFWPLDPGAVGALLEEQRLPWRNLQRWQQSGRPQRWVESLQASWDHADWLALVDTLRQSEFWPLDLSAAGSLLEDHKRAYRNLVRWQVSGHARRWVELRQGQWDADAWRALLDALRQSEFWPLEPEMAARVVEGLQREWWNVRRWRDSGLARRWVETHHGQWNHDDWLSLLASLRSSGYWPVEPAALGQVLEEVRAEWRNLRRWQESGQPRHWVDARSGGWQSDDLQALLDSLWESEFWPLDVRAAEGVLETLARARAPERVAATIDEADRAPAAVAVLKIPPSTYSKAGRKAA